MIQKIYNHNCSLCPLSESVPAHEWVCVEGSGDWSSRALILGEAPGKNESEKGIPFVGQAGELLDTALVAAGIDRSSVFVTNTVKCRPPENRKPEIQEEQACREYLRRELKIVNPVCVLALGNHALRAASGLWGITKYVGIWQAVPRRNKEDLLILPCYHPAYILRNRSLTDEFCSVVHEFVRTYQELLAS